MTTTPYTHLTLSLQDQTARLVVSFHTPKLLVSTLLVDGSRPMLDISTPEANVSISTTGGGPVTADDVAVAQKIFTAAARYLAECERLQVRPDEQTATPDGATATDTAT